jgi:adenylate cyclase, class 2
MYEAEIKLVVIDPTSVRVSLDSEVIGEDERYEDHYFTHETLVPRNSTRELRVREVQGHKETRALLTFKDEVVDIATQSKQEHETQIANADEFIRIMQAIGFNLDINFTKICTNWRLLRERYEILVTLVTVPELSGHYLELETLVKEKTEIESAIEVLRLLANSLGLDRSDETTATYTESVRNARTRS